MLQEREGREVEVRDGGEGVLIGDPKADDARVDELEERGPPTDLLFRRFYVAVESFDRHLIAAGRGKSEGELVGMERPEGEKNGAEEGTDSKLTGVGDHGNLEKSR